jgi:hypothetical protein
MERQGKTPYSLSYGMHVFDSFEQRQGTVLLVKRDHFVLRQELAQNQIVELPRCAIAGIVAPGFVFLNFTPSEINLYGKVLARREFGAPKFEVEPRVARRPMLQEAT